MTHTDGLVPLEDELDALKARRDALKQAASLPRPRLRPTLDAALAELDAAIEALGSAEQDDGPAGDQRSDASQAERRLLTAMFQDAPVPLFLLERDGTVRRANRAAGELLDTGTGYATGKPFTTFVNLPSRAAVHTHLATVMRTGHTARLRCELLTSGGTVGCELTAGLARPRGDSGKLIIAVRQPAPRLARPGEGGPPGGNGAPGEGGVPREAHQPGSAADITALTRRLDLATAISRLLLESGPASEAVMLQRCAELLARELVAWVLLDVARGERLLRQFVVGPEDRRSAELARDLAARDPQPGSLPRAVHDSGRSQLIAHAQDAAILGDGPGEVPLLMLLGATSVLSVPVTDGQAGYGALTLARRAEDGHFEMADLGLVEELGEQLALAIKMDRAARQRTGINDALRASLLPPGLPGIPGAQIATAHLAADSPEMGGDFYDAYRTGKGWGLSIGDVGGRGDGVAAVGAAARHAIRVIGHFGSDPARALTSANEIILAEEFGGRFVTACAAHLEWRRRSLKVTLASAGHPGPVLLRKNGRARQMRGGGLPLGLFPETELGVEEHSLAAGDALVLFTDGLIDARSQELGCLGDRLVGEVTALAGLPPDRMVARLRELAMQFCRGQPHDDITVVALVAGEPPVSPPPPAA